MPQFENAVFQQGFFRMMEKLKEIEMLEERHRCGFFLFPTQFKKMERRKEYEAIIEEIKNGTWSPPKTEKKENNEQIIEDEEEEDDDDDDDDDGDKSEKQACGKSNDSEDSVVDNKGNDA